MADERPGGPPATPAIGAVPLPPGYVLVERLGSGGFATVWLAEQGRLGRRVAVKLLGETLEDSERERRFIAECRAIGRLSGHPSVVTVHDAGTTDDGHPYLVMEHLPGGSLHDRLHRQGPLPWPEVLDVGVHVADALAAAHDAGILHRDVKPANVLLDENGSPKLGDFGIARLAEGTNTATGTLVGTIPFTPPEVLSGHRPGPTADVWALGATLHTLLVGSSPFGGHRDEPPAATIARVLRSEPPALGPDVPASLRGLISDTLRAEPRDRPATAGEVVAALQEIQGDRGLPVTPARAARRAPLPTPTGGTDATVVGLAAATGAGSEAVVGHRSPPAAPEGAPSGPPPPPSPPPPPPGPNLGKPAGDPDPQAATVVRSGADAPVGTQHPPAAPEGPQSAPTFDPSATATGPAVGATSVLPVHDGAAPPPGRGPGLAPPPPPPGPGAGASERRSKAPLLVGLAVVLILVLVAGVGVALLGGGDDDQADGSTTTGSTDDGGTTPDDPAAGGLVDGPLGTPLAVPAGLATEPSTTPLWDQTATCSASSTCSIVPLDGGVVTLLAPGDGSAPATVTRFGADGTEAWSTTVDGVVEQAALALRGDRIIVSSTSAGTRTYQGLDLDGTPVWSFDLSQADRPVFPPVDPTARYAVLLLADVDAYVVLDLASGATSRGEGRVLATDRLNVYVADGDRVVARTLGGGNESWEAAGVVSAAPQGELPAWRYGVAAAGAFVTVTATDVVGLNPESGGPTWDPVPLSADGVELGRPIAVSKVGDVVVVAAELGDLGIDATDGSVRWRIARERLVLDPALDAAAIEAAGGTSVWIGSGDRLLVGHAGARLQLVDVTTGEIVGSTALDPIEGGTSLGVASDGIALIGTGGTITAWGYDTLDAPRWEITVADARTLAPLDGGLAVVDPAGVHGLRPA